MEYGINHEYKKSLDNEDALTESKIKSMSKVTKAILESIDYQMVAKRRRENYAVLDKVLGLYNPFWKEIGDRIPMIYPLYIENEELRWYLVEKKIYVSQWWKCCIGNGGNKWEENMSKYFIPLPLDQRYDEYDMRYLIEFIEAYLKEEKHGVSRN